ncbi:serine/arginine repetitive matrix protein 1-like [Hemicordylus capensis]|uniref:serine/arginine repetitive matrix protein 1-like n=1 Tax=Hemicordylus capensis TaxID=884348 RepID=UPI0023046882|nr:serine/arginine repetitive matrix protein 1-like [Hemicordylus capensis]
MDARIGQALQPGNSAAASSPAATNEKLDRSRNSTHSSEGPKTPLSSAPTLRAAPHTPDNRKSRQVWVSRETPAPPEPPSAPSPGGRGARRGRGPPCRRKEWRATPTARVFVPETGSAFQRLSRHHRLLLDLSLGHEPYKATKRAAAAALGPQRRSCFRGHTPPPPPRRPSTVSRGRTGSSSEYLRKFHQFASPNKLSAYSRLSKENNAKLPMELAQSHKADNSITLIKKPIQQQKSRFLL